MNKLSNDNIISPFKKVKGVYPKVMNAFKGFNRKNREVSLDNNLMHKND